MRLALAGITHAAREATAAVAEQHRPALPPVEQSLGPRLRISSRSPTRIRPVRAFAAEPPHRLDVQRQATVALTANGPRRLKPVEQIIGLRAVTDARQGRRAWSSSGRTPQ